MTTFITITYICRSNARSLTTFGTEQTLSFECNLFDTPRLHTLKTRRFSHRGDRVATAKKGQYNAGRIETPIIRESSRTHWIEFYESVANDESFQIDARGLTGVNQIFAAFIPADVFAIQRIGLTNTYRTGFDFRTLVS